MRRGSATARHLLVVTQAEPGTETLITAVRGRLMGTQRFRPLPLTALSPLMRQRDAARQVPERIGKLREDARKALLGLDHKAATTALDQALQQVNQSYLRFYQQRTLVELRLLSGVLALQRARPDLARRHFTAALHFQPTLVLDAHYSPQVRAAFSAAKKQLGAAPAPTPQEMSGLAGLDDRVRHALVLSSEKTAGKMVLLKALFYSPEQRAYTSVESFGVLPGAKGATAALQRFGDRLRQRAAELFPPLPVAHTQPTSRAVAGGKGKGAKPKQPTAAWYKRWYVWVGAATLVGGAIALPFLTRRRVVDVAVSWK